MTPPRIAGECRARAATVVALLLVASAAGAATYMDDFEKGRAAVQDGRFAEGRDLLLRALAERDDEGRLKLGARFIEYTPSQWLAEAYLGLGDLEKARQRLRVAESVRSSAEGQRQLADLRRRLEAADAAPTAAGSEAGTEPAPPRPAAESPRGPSATASLARQALDGGRFAEARRLAEEALSRDPDDAAAREVMDAVTTWISVRLSRARDEMKAGDLAAARGNLEEVRAVAPDHAGARVLLDDLEAARSAAARVPRPAPELPAAAAPSVVDPPPASAQSPPSGGAPSQAGSGPPAEPAGGVLAVAARHYFRGDVDACIATLDSPADARGLGLLAAARATRSLLQGQGSDGEDVLAARDLYRQARAVQQDFTLDPRLFSPSVLALLGEARP